jgi:hypothetical protein
MHVQVTDNQFLSLGGNPESPASVVSVIIAVQLQSILPWCVPGQPDSPPVHGALDTPDHCCKFITFFLSPDGAVLPSHAAVLFALTLMSPCAVLCTTQMSTC